MMHVPGLIFSAVNLGKWVLANLFAGLIKAEASEAAKQEQQKSTDVGAPSRAALQRGSAPTYIALDQSSVGAKRRLRPESSANGSGSLTPGGLLVGLAIPAATPAIMPDGSPQGTPAPNLDAWANRGRTNDTHLGNTLATIPQSPALGGTPGTATPGSTALSALKSPKADSSNGKDYFSFPSKRSKASTPGPITTKDPSPTRRPDSAALQTPGGSQASFMGKFKGFGGKSKKANDALATPSGSITPLISSREDGEVDEVCIIRGSAQTSTYIAPHRRQRLTIRIRRSLVASTRSEPNLSTRLTTQRRLRTTFLKTLRSSFLRPIKMRAHGLSRTAAWYLVSNAIWTPWKRLLLRGFSTFCSLAEQR